MKGRTGEARLSKTAFCIPPANFYLSWVDYGAPIFLFEVELVQLEASCTKEVPET